MRNIYYIISFCLLLSASLQAAVGDTTVQDNIRYIIVTEDATSNNYEVTINLIYEQPYVNVPASILYYGNIYKVSSFDNDNTGLLYYSIFETGDSINPKRYTKVDFSEAIHIENTDPSYYPHDNNELWVNYAIIDTLIFPPNITKAIAVHNNYQIGQRERPEDFDGYGYGSPFTARSSTPYLYGVKRIFSSGNAKMEKSFPYMTGYLLTEFLLEVDFSTVDMDSLDDFQAFGGHGMFSNCWHLEKVRLPNKLKYIGMASFHKTYNLKDIILPDSLEKIDYAAFSLSSGLDSIRIPKNVKDISFSAFVANHSMKKFNVDTQNKYWKDISGVLFSKSGRAIHTIPMYQEVDTYTFPNEVDSITGAVYAYNCTMTSTTTRGFNADTFTFEHRPVLETITVNRGLSHLCDYAFAEVPVRTIENFENCNVMVIPSYCFANSRIEYIKMPPEISVIEQAAFCITYKLDHIDFDYKYLKQIGNYAFAGSGIKVLDLSRQTKLTEISQSLCAGAVSLRKVILPSSIDTILYSAFSGCSSLDTFMVNALEPPFAYDTWYHPDRPYKVFEGVDKSKCLLLVPSVSLAKYKSAPVWKEFFNVEADMSVCVVTTKSNDLSMGKVLLDYEDVSSAVFKKGDKVELGVSSKDGFRFVEWSDGYTKGWRTVYVMSDTLFTAIFERDPNETYRLTLNTSDSDLGTVEAEGNNSIYHYGDTAIVNATANIGALFLSWSDGVVDNPRKLVISQDTSLLGVFEADNTPYALNVESKNMLHGSVIGSGSYAMNEEVEMGALANEGYVFDMWNDSIKANPRTIIITQDTTFVATFDSIPTNIENAYYNNIQVFSKGNVIYVEGDFSKIEVFSSLGKLEYSGSSRKIAVRHKGVYVVRVDGSVVKVVVK